MRTYAPLLSDLIPQKSDLPLQPSNIPAPLTQISELRLQPLALNTPPQPSVTLQGRGGLLFLPSVVHAHAPLILALRL